MYEPQYPYGAGNHLNQTLKLQFPQESIEGRDRGLTQSRSKTIESAMDMSLSQNQNRLFNQKTRVLTKMADMDHFPHPLRQPATP